MFRVFLAIPPCIARIDWICISNWYDFHSSFVNLRSRDCSTVDIKWKRALLKFERNFKWNFYRRILSRERAAAVTNYIDTCTDCSHVKRFVCIFVRKKLARLTYEWSPRFAYILADIHISRKKTREIDVQICSQQRDWRERLSAFNETSCSTLLSRDDNNAGT